ncbi:MAG TPA: TatD family hydrolase [Deltaproteobacteria bacterium]|nr:TatD family hydrolase [Deltaproteobacteria bacterium]
MMNYHNSCEPTLIDSHNHLHFNAYKKDRDSVMGRAATEGVTSMLLVGIDPDDSLRALAIARTHDGLYAAIGIHPQMAGEYAAEDLFSLAEKAKDPKVVAVGETGFDLFRTPESEGKQRELFTAHIELAKRLGLPIIIHDRDAHEQTTALLDEREGWSRGGVFHCFSGDVALARKVLDEGFYVSVPGVVTYKNASRLHEVVAFCPLERLLIETDAPYLSPEPYRGKRNEPSYIRKTAEAIARIKGLSFDEVARATTENFSRLFVYKGRNYS